jgi:large subunit ribosomal protein L25
MAGVQLAVDQRTVMGKPLRGLRRKGIIPAHLYGHGIDSLALQAPTATIINLLRTAGRNDIIDLQIAGEGVARPVMLRGVQRDPVSDALVHIDFFQISLTERLRADVPLTISGEAPAVQVYGGILLLSLDRVTVEALPADIPSHFEVDVSGLAELDTAIHVRDLEIPENVVLVSDPDQVIVKVATPKLAAEEEVAAPAVEGEEAAAAAEGAAPAAEGAAPEEKSE